MSHKHSILNLLGIKDKNIKVMDKDWLKEEVRNGLHCKIISAKLTYTPEACKCCGCVNEGSIVKNGTKLTHPLLLDMAGCPTYLELKKQRFLCRECGQTFIAETCIVKKRCHITNDVKRSIAVQGTRNISEKDLALEHRVSNNTVKRVFGDFYDTFRQVYTHLPENLAIDEFKSVKSAEGAMSLIICDSDNKKIFDILEDRRNKSIMDYFMRFPQEQRAKVKTVVVDLYGPYQKLFQALFPQAELIIDRFHIVTQVNRALNMARVSFMNTLKKSKDLKANRDYRKLKKYWKLILKKEETLNSTEYRYHRLFKGLVTERGIIDYLLSLDEGLRLNYNAYQTIIFTVNHRKPKLFSSFVHEKQQGLTVKMDQALKTFRQSEKAIINALNYDYSNGLVEGINNKIKVIKRAAYGYRNFSNFRNRIFIEYKLLEIKTAA
ncbi:hypothetical protein BW727_101070 [Jeotgalibaca dankookensis]|uniref:Transposase IS204/IS1001/IS1096/IS1165 DDE domain-containing protein n=2 Tax=Jeotgalibaca dankookensis TaxID=708126 RepID=A0A1S6IPR0_9LACT|nr:ISL3 family transposase [Jeotgalibaca dankookensis]AQS52726.1 hypothetical protein BW727_100333 [Jeotgalibaca dankookensis]AQS53440.1 hypothetical protein BW727_101070 [Jeotgalibaca dankookensis]